MSNQKEEEKEKEQLCIERGVVSLYDSFFQVCYLTRRSISVESINGNPLQFRVKLFHYDTLQVVLILPPKQKRGGVRVSPSPPTQRHSIFLTTLASLCPCTLCSEIDGGRLSQVYSGAQGRLVGKRALQTSNAETSLAGTQTHTHARRLDLLKSMSIRVRTVSGPQLFIFLDHELMGGICGCSELSNYSNQVL